VPTQLLVNAVACWHSGRHLEAEALCRAAVKNDPTDADAHRLLAKIHAASGQIADAVAACQRVAELAPLDAANLQRLAELFLALARPADALATFDLALRHAPQLPGARRGRIHALLALAQPQVALAACEELLAAQPAIARVRGLRAVALLALQRPSDALAAANEATIVEPADAQAHVALGGAALAAGLPERALPAFEQALSLSPTLANACAGRGLALVASGRETEAIDALAQAVQQDPQAATGAFLQAGYQMLQLGHPGSAHAAFCKLLEAQPDHREAQEGRVIALIAMNRYDEAAAGLATLRAAFPATDYLSGISFHVQLQCCDWTDFDTSIRALAERVRRGERADAPLTFIVHNESQADQILCARTYVADKCSVDVPGLPRRARAAESRLRVGYLSSDFRNHAVAQLAVGVFESHDRSRFETYAFSTGPDDGSELRRRTERSFEHFLQVAALSDVAIASRMAELSIDIVIDLGGHSMGGRPRVLAYRPAPVQVGFLGFPGTLGADFIDYIVADPYVIPPADRIHYAEQVIYLPDCCLPADGAPAVISPPSRTEAGLPARGFVYCCFNAPYKISPRVFDVWMRLLKAVPDSVLWLRDASAVAKNNLAKEAARRGVDPSRLIYAARTPTRAEHYSRFALADVFLDTRPYNAHTTATDALGVGVPVITMRGKTFASRVAYSLLNACDLGHLATETLEQYEQLAIDLALAPQAVADLKAHLHRVHTNAPLFDSVRFCRHLEAAYSEIWARHARGEQPSTLWVERRT
jgi:protein O-GlcNAc transferase